MRSLRPAALLAALAGVVALGWTAPAPAHAAGRVVLAFLPDGDRGPDALQPGDAGFRPPSVLDLLNAEPRLALGLSSATQGAYVREQAYLDITQGTRVATGSYDPEDPPPLTFVAAGGGGRFLGFAAARARADDAPADLRPGLLAGSIPGGGAYAGLAAGDHMEALAAADRDGRVAAVSLGRAADLPARAAALLRAHPFVVVGLPPARAGAAMLARLLDARAADTLLLVMQAPPRADGFRLLPVGAAGLGGAGALTSATTRQEGVVAGIDVLPTVLGRLGIAVPAAVTGQPIRVEGARDAAALTSLDRRLRGIGARRFASVYVTAGAWIVLLLLGGLLAGPRGYRWALRVGALAMLWLPATLLLCAQVDASRGVELAIAAAGGLLLGALSDAVLPWPRAPLLPCAVALLAIVVDLAFGSPLIIRSVVGPNPLSGFRFYGIGNELEAMLPALLFVGLAAALDHRPRSRAMVGWFVGGGLVLGAVVGAGTLGADVGGVITIGVGTAAAALLALPGGVSRRAVLVAVLAPVAALVLLALIDTLSGGSGHFTRTVLRAQDGKALEDVVARRYELAWGNLKRQLVPLLSVMALLGAAVAVRRRDLVYGPLGDRPAWTCALAGTIAAAIAGALANDSGPVLLIVGIAVGAFATAYVRGAPALAGTEEVEEIPAPGR